MSKKYNKDAIIALRKTLSVIEIAKLTGYTRARIYQMLDINYNSKRRALSTARRKMLDTKKRRT